MVLQNVHLPESSGFVHLFKVQDGPSACQNDLPSSQFWLPLWFWTLGSQELFSQACVRKENKTTVNISKMSEELSPDVSGMNRIAKQIGWNMASAGSSGSTLVSNPPGSHRANGYKWMQMDANGIGPRRRHSFLHAWLCFLHTSQASWMQFGWRDVKPPCM